MLLLRLVLGTVARRQWRRKSKRQTGVLSKLAPLLILLTTAVRAERQRRLQAGTERLAVSLPVRLSVSGSPQRSDRRLLGPLAAAAAGSSSSTRASV
jgi:hypothetical protein